MLPAILLAVSAQLSPLGSSRHRGLFLRLDLGLGYFTSSNTNATGAGPGLGSSISLGGNVAENLALFGSFFGARGGPVTSACPLIVGVPCPISSAAVGGAGIGLTYYLMPANVFFSGTLGLGSLVVTSGGTDSTKRTGLLSRFGAGKEWFVSESWGVGVAGYVLLGSNKDDAGAPAWATVSPLLAFSATFY